MIQTFAGFSEEGNGHSCILNGKGKMIRSAVVPVAGLGTRLLPATRSQPKEMLPVARKPVVEYVIDELEANGIAQILFVTGRNKTSIEDHFDLGASESPKTAKFFYTRQGAPKGLGDAVLAGEHFAGEKPFVVALGDSILGLHAKSHAVSRMIEVFEQNAAACVVAVEEVPLAETGQYGIVAPAGFEKDAVRVAHLVEKPGPETAPSRLAIAGRYIFSPRIFDEIRRVEPDKRGEIQLTDAIERMCTAGLRVYAVQLTPEERRYDVGNFASYFEAFVEFALADPAHGEELKEMLRKKFEVAVV
jgi:UTP--glucose-1-phosphate uridylyltransferase